MTTFRRELRVEGRGPGLHDVTQEVQSLVRKSGVTTGLCSVFVQHTSASLCVQENADPAVLRDLEKFLARIAPEEFPYEHDAEGPDDMPAHIRAVLTKTSETLPVTEGRLALGTWQALYLWEHRRARHTRTLVVTVFGD
ncbi:MAG TPA: secondary thiamine-phosphate synthase enzyme YjbQ [Myxococcales bacterium]|nr:secondary thiamine-phosphate synthase enzyme YjbQ [Myxococcales bacterium]